MARRGGFTLLEVLVAFAIAAMAMFLLYQGTGESLNSVRTATRYTEAVSRAHSHLAALGWVLGAMPADSDGDDGDGFHYHLHVEPVAMNPASPRTPPAQRGISTLYAVAVAVSWSDGGYSRSFTLHSMRLGPPSAETAS